MSSYQNIGNLYPSLKGETFYTENDYDFNYLYTPTGFKTTKSYVTDTKVKLQTNLLSDGLLKVATSLNGEEKVISEPTRIGTFFKSLPVINLVDNSVDNSWNWGSHNKTENKTTVINESGGEKTEKKEEKEKEKDQRNLVALACVFGSIALVFGFLAGRQMGALKGTRGQQVALDKLIDKWNGTTDENGCIVKEGHSKRYEGEFVDNLDEAIVAGKAILDQERYNRTVATTLNVAMAAAGVFGFMAAVAGSILVIKGAAITAGVVLFAMACRAGYEWSLQSSQKDLAQTIIDKIKANAALTDNEIFTLPSAEEVDDDWFNFLPAEKYPSRNPNWNGKAND
jgi:hypothetical protein